MVQSFVQTSRLSRVQTPMATRTFVSLLFSFSNRKKPNRSLQPPCDLCEGRSFFSVGNFHQDNPLVGTFSPKLGRVAASRKMHTRCRRFCTKLVQSCVFWKVPGPRKAAVEMSLPLQSYETAVENLRGPYGERRSGRQMNCAHVPSAPRTAAVRLYEPSNFPSN